MPGKMFFTENTKEDRNAFVRKERFMGFLVLIILIGVVIAIVASSSSGNKSYSGYNGGYVRDYDEDD